MSPILNRYVTSAYRFHRLDTQKQDTLTFIVKHGRRSVLNHENVSVLLQRIASERNLMFEEINLENISYFEQLKILSRTKILVTNGGASAFCTFLLPKPTIVIYFPIFGNAFVDNLAPFRGSSNAFIFCLAN